MASKTLKAGWIFLLIAGLQRIISGIYMLTTDSSLDSVVLFLAMAVALICIALAGFKEGLRFSWFAAAVLGLTPPVYCLIVHAFNVWPVVGLIFILPALLIPVKDFFVKS